VKSDDKIIRCACYLSVLVNVRLFSAFALFVFMFCVTMFSTIGK